MFKRPEFVTEEQLDYLDALRVRGNINMFSAYSHIVENFGLDDEKAKQVVAYWRETFGEPDR